MSQLKRPQLKRKVSAKVPKGMYYPVFRGRNPEKLNEFFRLRQGYKKNDPKRYPIGCKFPYRVDISFGLLCKKRPNALFRLNTNAAIQNSQDKLKTKRLLEDVDVPIATPYAPFGDFLVNQTEFDLHAFQNIFEYPVMAKRRSRSGGEGMHYIENSDQLISFITATPLIVLNKYYFEAVVNFTHEYRIHAAPVLVGHPVTYTYQRSVPNPGRDREWNIENIGPIIRKNGVILSVRKMMRQEARDRGQIIRSYDPDNVYFNTRFVYPGRWEEMVTATIKALEATQLHFGFTDVLSNNNTGEFVISETGSNPGMPVNSSRPTPNITAQHYQQAFPHIIMREYDRITGKVTKRAGTMKRIQIRK